MNIILRLLLGGIAVALTIPLHAQTMPKASLFAEGVITVPGSFATTFAPDGKTLFFAKREDSRMVILSSHLRNGSWTAPQLMDFAREHRNVDPFLSPDGKALFFSSNRPLEGKDPDAHALWMVKTQGDGWGAPCPVLKESLAKPGATAVFPSPVANGTLYFAGHLPDPPSLGKDDIYRARRVADGYAPPENVGPPISTEHQEYDAYVAPDESYMIFASDRPGGFGASDLYISVRKDGRWSTPVNMGPSVNSESGLCCPSVSPDGSRFYFTTSLGGKQGIYEIDFPALTRALGVELPAKASRKD